MNPIESVETRYAILLPNGKLSSELPDTRVSGEKYTTLPDQTRAYVWEQQESAEFALGRMIAETPFGTGALLEQHSRVVELTITHRVELANDPDAPPEMAAYHKLPPGPEREIRSLLSIMEESLERGGEDVKAAPLVNKLREIVAGIDNPEPRTWAKAEDVPIDVTVRAVDAEHPDTLFRWRRHSEDRFQQWYGNQYDGSTSQQSVSETWPGGFVEVL